MLIFLLIKCELAFAFAHFFSKNSELDLEIVLTRTANILTTNKLVKLVMLRTGLFGGILFSIFFFFFFLTSLVVLSDAPHWKTNYTVPSEASHRKTSCFLIRSTTMYVFCIFFVEKKVPGCLVAKTHNNQKQQLKYIRIAVKLPLISLAFGSSFTLATFTMDLACLAYVWLVQEKYCGIRQYITDISSRFIKLT